MCLKWQLKIGRKYLPKLWSIDGSMNGHVQFSVSSKRNSFKFILTADQDYKDNPVGDNPVRRQSQTFLSIISITRMCTKFFISVIVVVGFGTLNTSYYFLSAYASVPRWMSSSRLSAGNMTLLGLCAICFAIFRPYSMRCNLRYAGFSFKAVPSSRALKKIWWIQIVFKE